MTTRTALRYEERTEVLRAQDAAPRHEEKRANLLQRVGDALWGASYEFGLITPKELTNKTAVKPALYDVYLARWF